jgi:tetratricopeptide (TPR) repeat protein
VFPTEGKGITSLRLEVLADSRLPGGGPGWGGNGNFWLNELTLEAATAGSADRAKAIPLRSAWADFSQVNSGGQGVQGAVGDVRGAVDGKAGTGWAIGPQFHRDHTAVFELAEEIGGGPTARLAVRLIHQQFQQNQNLANLGRFRISVSGSPATVDWERKHAAAPTLADPWHKLAAAYHVIGNQPALDELLRHHPAAESGIAQLYVAAGRTREAVPFLAKASAANPQDTILSNKVAALQAWFGKDAELAVTCRRGLAYARDSTDPSTAERTAKICSLRPMDDAAERAAALDLARRAVKLGTDHQYWPWYQMALGMAEYRSGNDEAAQEALRAAVRAAPRNDHIVGTSAFYRAMSLFRQGQEAEARRLATDAVSRLEPLPADEQNPLTGGLNANDLILWMAFKEARAVLQLDAAPARAPAPAAGK